MEAEGDTLVEAVCAAQPRTCKRTAYSLMIETEQCAEKIRWVAASIHESDEFRSRARAAANELGADSVEMLSTMFHSEHSPPKELAGKFPGLSDWIAARQFAIFEIYYHFRGAALTVLRRVAFGEYDWTQGNAIEVLCRLAAEDVDRDQIIADIRREFPSIRYEAQLYAIGPLLKQAKDNTALAEVLREFGDMPEYQDILQELKDAE